MFGANLSIDLHMRSRISVDDTASVEEFGASVKFESQLITLVTTVKRIFPKA